jgi:DNA polymerase-3 subunit delta
MARITAADVLGATTLIVGPNEFLVERAVDDVRRAVRKDDADADVTELTGDDLGPGALAEITSPSLFASLRCVIVRDVESVPAEGLDQLEAYVASPAPDVALSAAPRGGVRGKAVLDRVRKAGAREIAAQALRRKELPAGSCRSSAGTRRRSPSRLRQRSSRRSARTCAPSGSRRPAVRRRARRAGQR